MNNTQTFTDDQRRILFAVATQEWRKLNQHYKNLISVTDLAHEAWLHQQRYTSNIPEFTDNLYRWGIVKFLLKETRPMGYRRKGQCQVKTLDIDKAQETNTRDIVITKEEMFREINAKMDLETIMQTLKPNPTLQHMLHLYYWKGYKHRQIAQQYNITVQAVQNRIDRFIKEAQRRFAA